MGQQQNRIRYGTLTDEERRLIRKMWKHVHNNLTKCGLSLFVVVFTDYPTIANYFPFQGPEDEVFEDHCKVFMHELDRFVYAMDQPEQLELLLKENGENHIPRRISPSDYDKLRKCLVKVLIQELGPSKFPPASQAAWDKALQITFAVIYDFTEQGKHAKYNPVAVAKRPNSS